MSCRSAWSGPSFTSSSGPSCSSSPFTLSLWCAASAWPSCWLASPSTSWESTGKTSPIALTPSSVSWLQTLCEWIELISWYLGGGTLNFCVANDNLWSHHRGFFFAPQIRWRIWARSFAWWCTQPKPEAVEVERRARRWRRPGHLCPRTIKTTTSQLIAEEPRTAESPNADARAGCTHTQTKSDNILQGGFNDQLTVCPRTQSSLYFFSYIFHFINIFCAKKKEKNFKSNMTLNLAKVQYNIRHMQTFAANNTPMLVPRLFFVFLYFHCTVTHKHLFRWPNQFFFPFLTKAVFWLSKFKKKS